MLIVFIKLELLCLFIQHELRYSFVRVFLFLFYCLCRSLFYSFSLTRPVIYICSTGCFCFVVAARIKRACVSVFKFRWIRFVWPSHWSSTHFEILFTGILHSPCICVLYHLKLAVDCVYMKSSQENKCGICIFCCCFLLFLCARAVYSYSFNIFVSGRLNFFLPTTTLIFHCLFVFNKNNFFFRSAVYGDELMNIMNIRNFNRATWSHFLSQLILCLFALFSIRCWVSANFQRHRIDALTLFE